MAAAVRSPAQPRGEARRRALLDAAVRLLARDGARAVTHRAVAREAGTTHGAPRYWFSTRDQLLDEALRHIAARQVAAVERVLGEVADAPPADRVDRLARHIAGPLVADRDATVARYELFLEAARRPRLRRALQDWGDAYRRLFAAELESAGSPHPEVEAELLLNLINGLLLAQLATPRPDFEEAVLRPALEHFLGRTCPTPRRGSCPSNRPGILDPS
jgi:TetR/AcrR family transcriptional regulator, regulator of biofilm formation and stress response